MTRTIGNPLSWGARQLNAAGHALGNAARHLGGDEAQSLPRLRPLKISDLTEALRLGIRDFGAMRGDLVMATILYPVIGIGLIWATLHQGALHLIFPLVFGFALVGPVVALGFYELSRRRDRACRAGGGGDPVPSGPCGDAADPRACNLASIPVRGGLTGAGATGGAARARAPIRARAARARPGSAVAKRPCGD